METKAAIETLVNHSSLEFTWDIKNVHLVIKNAFIGMDGKWYGDWDVLTSDIFEVGAGTSQHSRWKFSVTKCDYYRPAGTYSRVDGLAFGIHFLGLVEFGQSQNDASATVQKVFLEATISGLNSSTYEQDNVHEFQKYSTFSIGDQDLYEAFISWEKICTQHKNLFLTHVMKIQCKLTLIGDTVTKTVLDFGRLSQQETQNAEQDFGQFYNNPELSDFSIILSQESASPVQFFAHKFILAARSPVLQRMLQTPMSETRENKLEIKDMDLQTLTLMLQFIYKGNIKIPEDKICIFGLLNAAKLYDLKGLSKLVLLKLQSLLNNANVGELTVAAYECARGHDEVISVLRNYCQTRQNILWKNPEYKKLYQQNLAAFMED